MTRIRAFARRRPSWAVAVAIGACLTAATAPAQGPAAAPPATGRPLGVAEEAKFTPISSNVTVYGGIVNAESCSYDPGRKLILAFNRGANPNQIADDGFVSLINPDGSVHTPRWIGLDPKGPLLHHPFGSAIHQDSLYVADSKGGTADGSPRIALLRRFDLSTGALQGEVTVPESQWLNDIAVAADGTVYASQTGAADGSIPYRIYRVTPDGKVSVFLEGAPLARPNGVAIDRDGNIVIVNLEDDRVMTFSPAARLLRTEQAALPGNDGLVIMADGTKYVSSVLHGGVSRIRPGRPAELIASGIPNAASMCWDSDANQLVIPMNANNGLAFIKLGRR
ncbi:gluconolaconase [Sphingomonas parva]|uniref:Gluconolaconase n=1 Tax=Sphingomonas parva TaxID=2555898 RepID=A0A4Y8ZNJ5_9SPHN|nr:SMP-30/gluconolactonase/LRE family protein [Sphingomonas parva]TFI57571.1 gluconolaconase [Sphingomonas parva]